MPRLRDFPAIGRALLAADFLGVDAGDLVVANKITVQDLLDFITPNFAAAAHTHPTGDIVNLSEFIQDTVATLLVQGPNITLTYNDGANTLTIEAAAGGAGYTDEQVRDVMGVALVQGAGITITPNDVADTITIASTITQYTDEMARDALGAALVQGAGITITPNDVADTITVACTITQYTDELAQDAVFGAIADSSTIDGTYNDAGNSFSLAVITQMSITSDASGIKLVNDSAAPGANMVYGTDGAGAKGWKADPGGGSGQSLVKKAGSVNQTAVSNVEVVFGTVDLTLAANDVIWFEAHGRIHNNSGATRTYTLGIQLEGEELNVVASTTIAANTITPFTIWGTIAIRSSSLSEWLCICSITPTTTDNGAAATAISRHAWRTSATNHVGANQTAEFKIISSGTGTQNFWVHGYNIRQIGAI